MKDENCEQKDCTQCRWFYSEIVKDHMFNPRNIFKTEEECNAYNADGIGEVGSPACGDMMRFLIKIEDNQIADCKWQTYGCGTAIASTSIFSEMIQGLSIEKALEITSKDIADELGGVPGNKFHCSILAAKALKEAVGNYRSKK